MPATYEQREWSVGRTDGGWHTVGYTDVEVTRAGEVVKRRALFWQRANVFGAEAALAVVKCLAERNGDLVREQTVDDLTHPMFRGGD
jgi:hypothetical protein